MALAKALIADYIGTLANASCYSMADSMAKLHSALAEAGYRTEKTEFLRAYQIAHEKYRLVRYEELREVTNAVWVSETLCSLGFDVDVEDERMKFALNVFFQDFVDSLELRPCAERLLQKATENCKVGLISNFTYAPVVYASLRKLGIDRYFSTTIVSQENGWRKPHPKIFNDALQKLQVKPSETVFIGDSPKEDIKGALQAGMKTVFVRSQFFTAEDLAASGEKPHMTAKDVEEICDAFFEYVRV
jgi:putative hydrolase of the HAD superfamily